MKYFIQVIMLVTILGFPLSAYPALSLEAQTVQSLPDVESTVKAFDDLVGSRSIKLQGNGSVAYVGFGSRLDQVITGGVLHLQSIRSSSLRESVSHIKIYLNDELMASIGAEAAEKSSHDVVLDGRFFKSYNQLKFELVGRIDTECYNPNDPALWWELSSASALSLEIKQLTLANELSLLPAPYFDYRDFGQVAINMTVPSAFSHEDLHAVAMVSTYFSSQAKWREVNFKVSPELANGHTVVFATNAAKPAFLNGLPPINEPTLQMVTHPKEPYSKLLLVLGKDTEQLAIAAKGLVAGQTLLSGSHAVIERAEDLHPRQPYDAPNWLPSDRPVRLSEIIDGRYQLERQGVQLGSIELDLYLPPDLFTASARAMPINLHYRHSPPHEADSGARLNLMINDQFVHALPLNDKDPGLQAAVWRAPLQTGTAATQSEVGIPGFKAGAKNTLSLRFAMGQVTGNECAGVSTTNHFAAVDESSTIDISGFAHYIRMPNLGVFSSSGFPYTRMADLSETAIIVSPTPSISDIELLLNTVGFLAKKTGLPASKFEIMTAWNEQRLENKDVIVLGAQASSMISQEGATPAFIKERDSSITSKKTLISEQPVNSGFANLIGRQPDVALDIKPRGRFASIYSFESPVSSKRMVTVLTGVDEGALPLIINTLQRSPEQVFGAFSVITNSNVSSYSLGDYFYIGELPLIDLVWYHFSNRPWLVVVIALLLVVAASILAWRMLSRYAKHRLANK